MELLQAIKERRTIRKFKAEPVPRELLEQLAVMRDEEHVEPTVTEHPTGLFSRIKDAFSGGR